MYLVIERALLRLAFSTVGTPTLFALIAVGVTGLILLDTRQTQTLVA
ncbi:MAG: hypothetical protein M3R24_32045 [Chloroflexota bacterium]|nr:hypothetical protein [Chloroflexota bacterium]